MRSTCLAYLFAIALIVVCVAGCVWPHSPNTVVRLARDYGVDETKILEVSKAFEVSPDELDTYGDSPFPVGCISERLKMVRREAGHVTKTNVEQIMQGYEIRCELSPSLVYYLYYNTDVSYVPFKLVQHPALVLRFRYE